MSTAGEHECRFEEVEIEPGDFGPGDPLHGGGPVLAPCECGQTAVEHLAWLEREVEEHAAALLQIDPCRPLYHWAPTTRRKQIIRRGLVPHRRGTTPTDAEYIGPVCFATSPNLAWALSGTHRPDITSWDLWTTWLHRLTDPVTVANDQMHDGLHEIRTMSRVYKRDLWLVGTRT